MADDYSSDMATSGVLATGSVVKGTFETIGDSDWFRLDLKKNHGYYFTPVMANGKMPLISVWLEGSPMVAYTTQPGGLFSNDLTNPFIVRESGNYFVEIYDAGRSGGYSIGLHQAPDDSGNDPLAARPLTAAASVAGSFDYAFDKDQFRIAAVAGMTYTVTLSSDSGNLGTAVFLRLTLEGGQYSSAQGGATTSYTFTAPTSGEYLISAEMASYQPPLAGGLGYHMTLTASDRSGPAPVAGAGTIDGALVVTLNEAAVLGQSGAIELRERGGQIVDSWSVGDSRLHLSGNTLTLDPGQTGALMPGRYSLYLNGNILLDATGNIGQGNYVDLIDLRATNSGGIALAGHSAAYHLYGSDSAADTVVYDGKPSDYAISKIADGFQVAWSWQITNFLHGIERVMFTDSKDVVALSLDGHLGQAFRLYTAAFDRVPDQAGLGFWLQMAERGMSLQEMARGFIASSEFTDLYGAAPGDSAFVAALYQNVLHREGEPDGVKYWLNSLSNGVDRGAVLAALSEGFENQAQVIPLIGNGIVYVPYG